MRAIIRHIHSPDVDLSVGEVADPTNFGVLIQLFVGPSDGPGEESFDVMVCTPSWIGQRIEEHGPFIGRHHLVVARFDPDQVRGFLTRHVEQLEANSWQDLAQKIGRIGRWEFEDYV